MPESSQAWCKRCHEAYFVVEDAHVCDQKALDKVVEKSIDAKGGLLVETMHNRDRMASDMISLIRRKAEAEALIKQTAEERMALASSLGADKALDVLLGHFVMGGLGGSHQYSGSEIAFRGTKTAIVAGAHQAWVAAVRSEENPAFPTFLLTDPTRPSPISYPQSEKILAALKVILIKYAKPFTHASHDVVKAYWRE